MNKKVVIVFTGIVLLCVMVGLIIAVIAFAVNTSQLSTKLNESNTQIENLEDQLSNTKLLEETPTDVAEQDSTMTTFRIEPVRVEQITDTYEF